MAFSRRSWLSSIPSRGFQRARSGLLRRVAAALLAAALLEGVADRVGAQKNCAGMAKHHPDLIMCRKQPGIAIGRLCEKCDGKCPVCDSYVRPATLVRICDECNYGSYEGRCVICGGPGISDAYYCKECTQQEKDRDGCPKIVNLGSSKTDLFYERKKYGFKKL